MQNSNQMNNPSVPPSGFAPPNQGQLQQQHQTLQYYGQPGPGQSQQSPLTMSNQQVMMGSGSSGMSMNYQSAVSQMIQQPSIQSTQQPSMIQQAMYGAQVPRPYSGPVTNVTSGFAGSSSVSMGMGGVQAQGQQSYTGQPQQQQPQAQQQQFQQQPQQSGPTFTGQQWQQCTSGPPQQGYVCPHGSNVSSSYPISSTGVASTHSTVTASQSGSQPATSKTETKRPLNPPPYSSQILEHLNRFSVGTLTVIGRELVSELTTRTHSLCMSLKAVSERKPPAAGDPEQLLEYCQMLMDKLVEIRLLIEKKIGTKRLNTTRFVELMSDMSPPIENIPADLAEKRQHFEENRIKLCTLNNDLKMLEWMASVTDPSLLKKVDKMATFIRERE